MSGFYTALDIAALHLRSLSRHVCGLPEAAVGLECLHVTVPWAGTSFTHPMPSVGIPLRVPRK